jgi:hypothetical protein
MTLIKLLTHTNSKFPNYALQIENTKMRFTTASASLTKKGDKVTDLISKLNEELEN